MPEISLTQAPAHARHGSNIGQPLTRRDGVLKVAGGARYAADHHPAGTLYAVLAVSSIARGRVTFLDVPAAKGHPGVVDVMTPANRPRRTSPMRSPLTVIDGMAPESQVRNRLSAGGNRIRTIGPA